MRAPLLYTAAACCVAAGLSLGTAHADTRTLRGVALALTLATDEDVTVEADPGLTNAVRVVGDSLDCLTANDGVGVQISTSACDSDMGHLAIMVPPAMPLSVEVAASGNVTIGDLKGPLKATISADGDLKVRHASVLQMEIRGSGDATIQAVDGPADIAINGSGNVRLLRLAGPLKFRQNASGDLAIVQIDSPAVDIESHGSGDVLMLGGHITDLRVRSTGNGDVAMAGRVGTADLSATGGGDIGIKQADGPVARHASGSSSIAVGAGADIAASAMSKLRASVSGDDDDDDSVSGRGATTYHHHGGFVHFVAGIVVLGLLFWLWRIVSRNGGFGRLGRAFGTRTPSRGAPSAPRDPGVVALCDLLAALERRLARVETHVTSREFELNRKFREIDAGQ
jgi:hypothetical protein